MSTAAIEPLVPVGRRVPPGHPVYAYRDEAGHLVLVAGGWVLVDLSALIEQLDKRGGTDGG